MVGDDGGLWGSFGEAVVVCKYSASQDSVSHVDQPLVKQLTTSTSNTYHLSSTN